MARRRDSDSDATFELPVGVENTSLLPHDHLPNDDRDTPLKTVIKAEDDRETPLKTVIQTYDDRETPLKTVIRAEDDRETPLKTVIQAYDSDKDYEYSDLDYNSESKSRIYDADEQYELDPDDFDIENESETESDAENETESEIEPEASLTETRYDSDTTPARDWFYIGPNSNVIVSEGASVTRSRWEKRSAFNPNTINTINQSIVLSMLALLTFSSDNVSSFVATVVLTLVFCWSAGFLISFIRFHRSPHTWLFCLASTAAVLGYLTLVYSVSVNYQVVVAAIDDGMLWLYNTCANLLSNN